VAIRPLFGCIKKSFIDVIFNQARYFLAVI
jgi:hypothetical protein